MCGIVGVIGKQDATEILLQGLKKLEYRGYDSAGLFVLDGSQQKLVKSVGRIRDLEEQLPEDMSGDLGIGHTRWATHGKPTVENAHPHQSFDGRFVLVHNGVIANFNELKEQYLSDVTFQSDTDTEVIVHLLAKMAQQTSSVKEAILKTMSLLEGSYSLVIIDVTDNDHLYVAKNKSPLLIGLGDGFNVVCSDAMAMISQTHNFVEIMDGEMVILERNGIRIFDADGQEVSRESYEANLSLDDIEKGTYDHYMLKEIDEQPTVMRRLIQEYSLEQQVHVDDNVIEMVRQSDRIYIIACGTSWHAGWIGKSLLESMAHVPVEVHIASEFAYHMPLLSEKPLFLFISQSGETADSRQVLVQIKEMGYPALTLTNVAGSTLSREADATMLLHAGPEIAVASTKAYTAQVAVLAILAKAVGDSQKIDSALEFDVLHELGIVANAMDSLIAEKEQLATLASDLLGEARNEFYIGRANDYYVSMEAALKLKEISYIQAEGFAAGELKHGTIALIEDGTPVIALMSDAKTAPHTRGNVQEVMSRGAHVATIVTEDLATDEDTVVVPSVHPSLTALVMVVPAQLIAYYAALQRGLDVDKPRNLAKSVTVE